MYQCSMSRSQVPCPASSAQKVWEGLEFLTHGLLGHDFVAQALAITAESRKVQYWQTCTGYS